MISRSRHERERVSNDQNAAACGTWNPVGEKWPCSWQLSHSDFAAWRPTTSLAIRSSVKEHIKNRRNDHFAWQKIKHGALDPNVENRLSRSDRGDCNCRCRAVQ